MNGFATSTATLEGVWWDRDRLFCGRDPTRPPAEIIDVTGRARLLAVTPFITLSPGLWRAEVGVQACGDAAKRAYLVEFGVQDDYAVRPGGPIEAGRSLIPVTRRLDREGPAQIRLWLSRAAFHGELRILGAGVRRVEAPGADAQ